MNTITKGFALGLGLGFAFGLGCATAATVIPPARAQASVERWEYLRIEHGWDDGRWANEAGQQGWELVQEANAQHWYFRRRVP